MSFKSIIILDGKNAFSYDDINSIKVLECEYSFSQALDDHSMPIEKPNGGMIIVTIESTADNDFMDWVISPTAIKSGRIVFFKRDGQGIMRDLKFTDAYCINYREIFHSRGSEPMRTTFTITPRLLTIGGAVYEKSWISN